MTNEEIYDEINKDEGLKTPSEIGVIPRDPEMSWDLTELESKLRANPEFDIKRFEKVEVDDNSYSELTFEVSFGYQNEIYSAYMSVLPVDEIQLTSYGFVNMVDRESIDLAQNAPLYLSSSMYFNEDYTLDYLVQLKLLNTLVPDAAIGIDSSSLRVFSPYWLKETAEASIPPSPNYLYVVHSVYDSEKGDKTEYWLHTHGLHRCGSVEFEMLVSNYPQEMHSLLTNTAHLALDKSFKENEAFQAGYDGMGINLAWMRWEEALQSFPPNILGGIDDRMDKVNMADFDIEMDKNIEIDDDINFFPNVHAEPSGILFASEDGELTSPEIYGPSLKDNPVFFVSNAETRRMTALARHKFDRFTELFNLHGPKKKSFFTKLISKKEEEWSFLTKIGLVVDGAEDIESDKEHLWFEIQSIDENNKITGKLLNQPYWIKGLNEGDVKTYPAHEVLTDWIIYSPDAQYTPDTIYAYFHQ